MESINTMPVISADSFQNYEDFQETEEEVRSGRRAFNEIQNGKDNVQTISMLKYCKGVHIGPRIEYHTHHANTAELEKKDEPDGKNILWKYKERLKNLYQTNYSYMRSFLWKGKRRDLPISDHFVELTVEKTSLFGKGKGEKVELAAIFPLGLDGHQTILVTGGPGYGKSTLCKKLAYDWANDEPSVNYSKHFDLLVIIVLRDLGVKSVKEALLLDVCHNSEKLVEKTMQRNNTNILVILDGFDEILNKSSILKFIREESFDISLRMTILLTSRSQAAEDIREDVKLRFSLQGFSRQQQKKYITLMFKENDVKTQYLICKLEKDELYAELAECPLMLHMLCCLHQSDDIDNIAGITDLYIRIFSLITERYNRKNIQNYSFERGKYFVGENLLIRLGKLLHYCRSISSKILKEQFPKEDEFNFIVGLDILSFYSFNQSDDEVNYEFAHRTFGEFLAAFTAYRNYCHDNSYDIADIYKSKIYQDKALLFLLGMFEIDIFPPSLLEYLKRRIFSPSFMIQAYKEVKLKRNWELFCSNTCVKFYIIEVDEVKELLTLYPFRRLFFCFPVTPRKYEEVKEHLVEFFGNSIDSNDLEIYLFLHVVYEQWECFHDIRQSASSIADLLSRVKSLGRKHAKIYFCGIYHVIDNFYYFRNVEHSVRVPEEVMKELGLSDCNNTIALQNTNDRRCFVSYLITKEQYNDLKKRIKVFPTSKQDQTYKDSCQVE